MVTKAQRKQNRRDKKTGKLSFYPLGIHYNIPIDIIHKIMKYAMEAHVMKKDDIALIGHSLFLELVRSERFRCVAIHDDKIILLHKYPCSIEGFNTIMQFQRSDDNPFDIGKYIQELSVSPYSIRCLLLDLHFSLTLLTVGPDMCDALSIQSVKQVICHDYKWLTESITPQTCITMNHLEFFANQIETLESFLNWLVSRIHIQTVTMNIEKLSREQQSNARTPTRSFKKIVLRMEELTIPFIFTLLSPSTQTLTRLTIYSKKQYLVPSFWVSLAEYTLLTHLKINTQEYKMQDIYTCTSQLLHLQVLKLRVIKVTAQDYDMIQDMSSWYNQGRCPLTRLVLVYNPAHQALHKKIQRLHNRIRVMYKDYYGMDKPYYNFRKYCKQQMTRKELAAERLVRAQHEAQYEAGQVERLLGNLVRIVNAPDIHVVEDEVVVAPRVFIVGGGYVDESPIDIPEDVDEEMDGVGDYRVDDYYVLASSDDDRMSE